jgi:16S rRNA G1207 methylase RsmC
MARRSPGATVWAIDVNQRALGLTRANAVAAGLANVRVMAPDDVPSEIRFDAIWSNPPIRIGKVELHALLQLWLPRLTADGSAILVVQRHLGADSLADWLRGQGWVVERLRSRMSYRLLEAKPAPRADPETEA